MSENAKNAINYVKKKDRSDIKVDHIVIKLEEWRTRKLNKTDATIQLFTSPENITRVHCSQLSVEDFV